MARTDRTWPFLATVRTIAPASPGFVAQPCSSAVLAVSEVANGAPYGDLMLLAGASAAFVAYAENQRPHA